ncbi:MAG TPA: trypsin-like serine protease [Kofleriaceae bacterium]
MRKLPFALLFVASSAFAQGAPIVGGTNATAGQYPAVVAIIAGGGLCTGTLITPEWVLTAAHCVLPEELGASSQAQVTSELQIRYNTVSALAQGGGTVGAQESFPHPMFNINNLGQHDIGLIHLKTPIAGITPVKVNLTATAVAMGANVTMVGFGASNGQTQGGAGTLRVVDQTVVSCAGDGGSDANLLCYNQSNGKGKCNGDSGGPSFLKMGDDLVQVGITSFGDQTCTQFGADTRVDAEQDFIKSHVSLTCDADTDCTDGHSCFNHACIVTPFAAGGLGATCTGNSACDSSMCGTLDGDTQCTTSCTAGAANTCPTGLECREESGAGYCWTPSGGSGGGCNTSGSNSTPALLGLGLVGLVLASRRRQR